MGQLLTFQTYGNRAEADEVAALLGAHNIHVIIEETGHLLDKNFTGVQYSDPFIVKIDSGDFVEAGKILADNIHIDLDTVDKNYMLFSMSNDDLLDLVSKPDEWGLYNCKLALMILEQRGRRVDAGTLQQLHEERYIELAKPRAFDKSWLLYCYVISIAGLVAAAWHFYLSLLSIFGLVMGWSILSARTTLPDGKRVVKYDDSSRKHGRNIFWLGLLTGLLELAFYLTHQLWYPGWAALL